MRSTLRDYEVAFDDGYGWAQRLAALETAFVVVDEQVWRLHSRGVLAPLESLAIVTLPATEGRKVFATVAQLCDEVTQRAAKRNCVVVSIGGGITQDITGFLASTLYRGVAWIYAPSTLLAMADSCIGGKTSLNHGAHKNLLGTMYPPERVIVHAPFVATLQEVDYFSGLGEMVKLHLLGGRRCLDALRVDLPALLVRDPGAVTGAVRRCLEVKRSFIEEDEFDRGRRNLLNFGHCFGHALETATGFAVPHGQAVVLGMMLAGVIATRRGLLEDSEERRRREELYRPVLRVRPLLDADAQARTVHAMRYDKKRTGEGLALVMVAGGLRAVRVGDLGEREAAAALAELPALLS